MGCNRGRRVVVIGGGIGGLTASLCLARSGAEVTVLEKAPAFAEVGAGLQVSPNGAVVLHALGLGDAIRRDGLAAKAVAPMDGITGRQIARFDLSGHGDYFFFHRAELIDLLAGAAASAGVECRTGCAVTEASPEGEVLLGSGQWIEADLVVGADGLHSIVRGGLCGPQMPFFTGQTAWRAVIPAAAEPVARIWMMPGRHVVTYPLQGGRLNIVAVKEETGWAEEGWNHPDDPANLRAAFADAAPPLRDLLGAVLTVRRWGLFRHEVARRWHDGRLAMLGDAAHPTLPFMAQGANLAIEDAWVLAAECDRSASVAEALAAYQLRRRDRVVRAIGAANANAVNYHLSGLRRRLSHAALSAIGRMAPDLFLRRLDWLYRHDVTGAAR